MRRVPRAKRGAVPHSRALTIIDGRVPPHPPPVGLAQLVLDQLAQAQLAQNTIHGSHLS